MATPRGSGKPLQCPHCNRPLHPMQTPEGLSVETCLPCKGVWVHGQPDRPAPRADSSIPIPFNCPSCVDPILSELHYRRENDELRIEYCRNCHGAWMEQGRMSAWTALISPPPAPRPAASQPKPAVPQPKPAASRPKPATPAAETYSPDDDLNSWRRMVRPALLVFGILIGLFVVRAMFSGGEPPKPAPPPKESRDSERRTERRERKRERPAERRAAEPELPPAPRDQPWSYTPTPVSESAPFGEGESGETEPKEEEEEEDGEEEE